MSPRTTNSLWVQLYTMPIFASRLRREASLASPANPAYRRSRSAYHASPCHLPNDSAATTAISGAVSTSGMRACSPPHRPKHWSICAN